MIRGPEAQAIAPLEAGKLSLATNADVAARTAATMNGVTQSIVSAGIPVAVGLAQLGLMYMGIKMIVTGKPPDFLKKIGG